MKYILSLILIIGLAMPCFGGSSVFVDQAITVGEIKSIKCARCGKSLTDESGSTFIGVSITVSSSDNVTPDHLKKQMGKYELGKEYNFCFECWLDSLMGGAK